MLQWAHMKNNQRGQRAGAGLRVSLEITIDSVPPLTGGGCRKFEPLGQLFMTALLRQLQHCLTGTRRIDR